MVMIGCTVYHDIIVMCARVVIPTRKGTLVKKSIVLSALYITHCNFSFTRLVLLKSLKFIRKIHLLTCHQSRPVVEQSAFTANGIPFTIMVDFKTSLVVTTTCNGRAWQFRANWAIKCIYSNSRESFAIGSPGPLGQGS